MLRNVPHSWMTRSGSGFASGAGDAGGTGGESAGGAAPLQGNTVASSATPNPAMPTHTIRMLRFTVFMVPPARYEFQTPKVKGELRGGRERSTRLFRHVAFRGGRRVKGREPLRDEPRVFGSRSAIAIPGKPP